MRSAVSKNSLMEQAGCQAWDAVNRFASDFVDQLRATNSGHSVCNGGRAGGGARSCL